MLPLDTPLVTPDGWTTIGAVRVGDVIIDERGVPASVTAVHPVASAPSAFRLTFSDGADQVACADHLWLTFDARELSGLTRLDPEWRSRRRGRRASRAGGRKSETFTAAIARRNSERSYEVMGSPPGTVRTTAEIAATLKTRSGRRNHAVPYAKPLELPPASLPLDPYVLGSWLGDGTGVTGVLTTADAEMIEFVCAAGFEATRIPSSVYGWRVAGLTATLRRMGLLGNKHIPAAYLRASVEQRIALLQGLMDTDGHACESGSCEFVTTNEAVRDGFSELAASLGIKSTWREGRARLDGRDIGPRYRFKFATAIKAFRLERKANRQNIKVRRTTAFRYVVACEPCASVPMRCISVDSPSRLYLAGRHMIPTHNSFALLLEPLRHINVPGFNGVIFRRTLADVKKAGSLLDTSVQLYGSAGGSIRLDTLEWKFKAGAKVAFGHLEHETTVLDWQGSQIAFLAFDELTHFSQKQFWYLLSRNRSMCGVRPYVRATTNPDADSWVAQLIAWWIDEKTGLAIPGRSGVLRWFARIAGSIVWGDSREEIEARYPDSAPKSLTFISAKLEDNAILMAADPGYRANLMAMDQVERERLLGGNWMVRPSSGLYFQRNWCEVVDALPAGARFVRGWDLAATPKTSNNNPDWTAGTKIGRCQDGRFVVAHHVRLRDGPFEVERAVRNTAIDDGREVAIHLPQDPGQAGKTQASQYARLLAGFQVFFKPVSGDKLTRFRAFSAQARAGNVQVLRGPWNDDWFSALESFPPEGSGHDDDADSTAEAFNALLQERAPLRISETAVRLALGGRSR